VDLAQHLGFSVTTVSRVINGKSKQYRISNNTTKLVLDAVEKLGYRPNELARGLRLKKTHLLGLVVPDISNPFFAHLTHVIQNILYKLGYSLMVCNTNEDILLEKEQIELMRRKGVEGFIIMPVGTDYEHIVELVEHNIPTVLLDRLIEKIKFNSVVVDNYKGSYQAVQYLIKRGHRRIAIIQGLKKTFTNDERLRGYRDALREADIEIDENLIVGKDFRKENGYIETKFLMNRNDPPTAIFAFSDLITLGVLQALNEENMVIPNDISLISFDDIDFAPYLIAPLTVVKQPKELMGEVAVKLLIEDIKSKGRSEKRKIILDPKLIIRKSVKEIKYNVQLKQSERKKKVV
ncbi:MAG: LacI family DNA-binding transcriptional regulator, partial [Ignavibacteriae bacterium]|nr:LacI family DNA-binding transcriptional regulator [Ignavibacteriota bacterium]